MRTGCRRLGVASLAVLVLIGTVALWLRFNAAPPGVGEQFPSDLVNYFYPLAVQAAGRLAHGELPLWNPYACSGIPLLATAQVGVFYPGNWLSLLLPVEKALPVRLFLECLLGGLFTGLWLHRLGLRVVACAMGGVLFVQACLLGQTFWPPQVATIVWLPWLLLCVESLCRVWRWRWWLGLGAGVACQLVAGFAQYVPYTFMLLAPYAALRLRFAPAEASPSAPRRAAGMLGAAALGVGLAAVQLLPTLELVGQGLRGAPLGPADVHYLRIVGLTPPGPWLFSNALDPAPRLVSFDFGQGSGYLGVAVWVLGAVALVAARPRHLVALLAAVGALSLLLSFGYRGVLPGLYELYASLPTGSWFRAPERFRVLTFLCCIALSALGLDFLARSREGAGAGRRRAALGAAALAAGLVAFFGPWAAGWRAGVVVALVGAAALRRGPAVLPIVCTSALALFAVADVVHATGTHGSLRRLPVEWSRTYHFLGTTTLDAEEVAQLRQEAGLGRIELNGLWPLTPVPPIAGLYRLACYEPLAPEPWPQLAERFATPMGGARVWGQYLFQLEPDTAGALLDVSGVVTVVTPDLTSDPKLAKRRWRSGLGPAPRVVGAARELWRNRDALPRAYLVESFVVRDTSEALDLVAGGGLDFGSVVVLDRDPGFPSGAARRVRPATVRAYAPERVEIEASTESDALLVLSDSFHPGWRAAVDGEAVEILRANGLYRAVHLTPGAHRVVFEYRPASLRRGAVCSAASLALLLALPLVARARR